MKKAFSIFLLFSMVSCSPRYNRLASADAYAHPTGNRPDYSQSACWAALPDRKDPSDSIPLPLVADYQPDSLVDVFFLHPTSFTDQKDPRWNASLEDSALNLKTDYSSILYQASAFNEYRVFAPRYRQANLKAYYSTDTARALEAFDTAYADIRAAFVYYLQHFNQGHAIIIASHSQGSTHAIRLLREFFDTGALHNKLVVAYIAGMYIPDTSFRQLPVCSDSLQTGCICGWRTFREGYVPAFVQEETRPSLVVNPLRWDTSAAPAGYNLNRGAVLRNFSRIYPEAAAASIHGSILWTGRPHFPGSFLLRNKNYHIGDINLYYLNIRYNLRQRVKAYFSHSSSAHN